MCHGSIGCPCVDRANNSAIVASSPGIANVIVVVTTESNRAMASNIPEQAGDRMYECFRSSVSWVDELNGRLSIYF